MFGFGKKKTKPDEKSEEKKKAEKGLLEGVEFHVMPSLEGTGSSHLLHTAKDDEEKGGKKGAKGEEKSKPQRISLAPPPRPLPPSPPPKPKPEKIGPPPVLARKPPVPHGAGKAALHKKSRWPLIVGIVVVVALLLGAGLWYFVLRSGSPLIIDRGGIRISEGQQEEESSDDTTPPSEEPRVMVEEDVDEDHFLSDRGLTTARDIDADLLTDEEEDIYGTDVALPDSDFDGWPDGWEIVHLYDPSLSDGALLLDNPRITGFKNSDYGYSILHPQSWVAQALDRADPKDIIITASTGEFIQIMGIELSLDDRELINERGLERYVRSQYPGGSAYTLHSFTNRFEIEGLQSADGLTVFIRGEGVVYLIRYMPGLRTQVNFKRTMSMMVAGFLVEPGIPPALSQSEASGVAIPTGEGSSEATSDDSTSSDAGTATSTSSGGTLSTRNF